MKKGLILGRFQPLHLGHLNVIQEVIKEKLEPIIVIFSISLLLIIYLTSLFIEWISPYGYATQDLSMIRSSPSFEHWLGTDNAGRDILTRVFWGVQNSLIITFISITSGSLFIGVTLGLISGYFGKWIDGLIQRIGEVFASFPDIFLIILLLSIKSPLNSLAKLLAISYIYSP